VISSRRGRRRQPGLAGFSRCLSCAELVCPALPSRCWLDAWGGGAIGSVRRGRFSGLGVPSTPVGLFCGLAASPNVSVCAGGVVSSSCFSIPLARTGRSHCARWMAPLTCLCSCCAEWPISRSPRQQSIKPLLGKKSSRGLRGSSFCGAVVPLRCPGRLDVSDSGQERSRVAVRVGVSDLPCLATHIAPPNREIQVLNARCVCVPGAGSCVGVCFYGRWGWRMAGVEFERFWAARVFRPFLFRN